ncbi:hypothetical protein HF086_002832 [Spodoptera exigua]|uniref:Copper transport protein n=1 Tax=Spodoptera exigua TaxID=7107 RepID=A0A922SJY9_SPOEX|nr:hypothetical protein HF086_002832 [Spodoptera exigua]
MDTHMSMGHAHHDHGNHMNMNHMMPAVDHDMSMNSTFQGDIISFHGGYNEVILFSWWKVTDIGEFVGSFFAVFLMALLYEGPTMMSTAHAWQTVLHGLQVLVSYMLMLVFMTYNTWLCAAVVLGSATGYFLFGWRESVVVDFTEHCH